MLTRLEHDHAGTDTHGDDNVQTNSHIGNGEEALHGNRGSERLASLRGGSTTIGTTVAGASSGGSSDRVSGLSALESGGAGGIGLGATVGRGLTIKVAGVGSVLLVLVVLVHDVAKLLEGVAHGVGTVDTGSGVAEDAGASSGVVAADGAKELTVVLGVEALGGNAGEGVVHALAEVLIRSRGKSIASNLPVRGDVGALGGLVGGLVLVNVNGLGLGTEDGGLELVVVLERLGGLAGHIDETIVVFLLEVHVDDTTREDVGHRVRVKSGGLLEDTGFSTAGIVATVLGEEDGDRVVLEEVDLLLVSRSLDGVLAAPLVDVVTPVVDGLILVTAVEVVGDLGTNLGVVVGGIANTNPALDVLLDVVLGVTDSSLDVSGSIGVAGVVGDLVTGEETDDVGVLGHLIDDIGIALEEGDIPPGVVAVDGLGGLGQIADNVDAGVVEELHAGGVVGLRVDGVGTDGVGASGLHDGNITLAGLFVGEGIAEFTGGCLAASASSILLIGNALDVELGAVLVEELGALWIQTRLALGAS